MCLYHNIHLRTHSLPHSFRYIECQILLCRGQCQIRSQILTIKIVCMRKRIKLQTGKTSLFYDPCLGSIVLLIMFTFCKPIICIQKNIFTICSSQQFIAGSIQYLTLQIQQSHINTTNSTHTRTIRAYPIQVTIQFRPNKIRSHRI